MTDASEVVRRLKAAATPAKTRQVADKGHRRNPHETGVRMRRKGRTVHLEFPADLPDAALRDTVELFIADRKVLSGEWWKFAAGDLRCGEDYVIMRRDQWSWRREARRGSPNHRPCA